MMWIKEKDFPNVNFMTKGEMKRGRIMAAYEDLTTVHMYNGIHDFVTIMDNVFEGDYSLSELMCAGVIITDGVDGCLKKGNYIMDGRYLNINDVNVFLTCPGNELLWGDEIEGWIFEEEKGGRFY